MVSGNWIRALKRLRKSKQGRSKRSKRHIKAFSNLPSENVAAIRIQTAFRAYQARRNLRTMKKLHVFTQQIGNRNIQASNVMGYIQTWNRVQSRISDRRTCMVTEGRMRQKRLESQMKVEAKLQNLEIEWQGGPETKEEIIYRIQERERAALKRERAMAYAFSHQWRVNNGTNGSVQYAADEFWKGIWGWSWMERWIAARPWELRIVFSPPSSNGRRPAGRPSAPVKKLSLQSEEIVESV